MTTMSDDGDRMCPLCTEEMDLTDQQLKPCKCGYEVCVWCWHHIMEMAEKEDTEGRCPACRTPYDKERIVGMAASCGRMVAEINAEKRQKFQKAKPKALVEARKHLSGVRVIQRNLVYIIGLPSNLCDESILEHREYFGQYGKVLKVSISRSTSATGQQAPVNGTFSVYITYAREEEAVRCIQAVHNFVLEGKSLRACFGTTKYCHAWLRNMTCSNPDCLYLHDEGCQEDSFTKDEIISAYTRSRVPQIASNTVQRRSGNILPPPTDDFSNGGALLGKHASKNAPNSTSIQTKICHPNSTSGKSTLPAAASWGLRGSNPRAATASVTCSRSKQKVETHSSSILHSPIIASNKENSAWHDNVNTTLMLPESKKVAQLSDIPRHLEPNTPGVEECQTAMPLEAFVDPDLSSELSAWNDDAVVASKVCEEGHAADIDGKSMCLDPLKPLIDGGVNHLSTSVASSEVVADVTCTSKITTSCLSSPLDPTPEFNERDLGLPGRNAIPRASPNQKGLSKQSNSADYDKVREGDNPVDGSIKTLCMDLYSVSLDRNKGVHILKRDQHQTSVLNTCSAEMPLKQDSGSYSQHIEHLPLPPVSKDDLFSDRFGSNEVSDWNSELQKQGFAMGSTSVADTNGIGYSDISDQTSSTSYYHHPGDIATLGSKYSSFVGDSRTLNSKIETRVFPSKGDATILSNGYKENEIISDCRPTTVLQHAGLDCFEDTAKCAEQFDNRSNLGEAATVDRGENSIISDILSLEFDPWDDSLSLSNNFVNIFGESEKRDGPFKLSNSWKSQNSNQSRFSFARQEGQGHLLEPSPTVNSHEHRLSSLSANSYGNGYQNGILCHTSEGPSTMEHSIPSFASDRPAGVSKAKISAPPGFSIPSKAPPPGFSSQSRLNQVYEMTNSENCLLGKPSLGSYHQAYLSENSDDVEFIDPAILAVGKGRIPGVNDSGLELKSAFPAQLHTSNNDHRLQLLMQQSVSSHQNLSRLDHIGDRFLPINDNLVSSRFLAQTNSSLSPFAQMQYQQPRNSHFANSQWDGWSDVRTSSNMGITDILRNDRFGLNLHPSNEDRQFHIPSSGDLYYRAFGM
ncbi:uncharacterized protein [Typha latifolia]|uniref:uncharacterized protein isoform X1 n=2 Tax=Typha latifolia TaxID=4733 RepID=UPI003C2DB8C2